MPSASKKQHNFFAAVAHSPSFAKKVRVPQSVGKDFNEADKGRKFSKGGDMKESKAMMKKEVGFMKKAGAPKSMVKHEKAEMMGMKKGGMPMVMKDGKKIPAFAAKTGGMAKKMMGGGMSYAKGGGVESKGKTKSAMIKMKSGGAAC